MDKQRLIMKKIILSLIIAGAAGYGVLSYHFILFDKSFKILKKSTVQYQNTFVDARGTKKLELVLKPDLISAGVNDLLKQVDGSSN
jgi:hypothetical protein